MNSLIVLFVACFASVIASTVPPLTASTNWYDELEAQLIADNMINKIDQVIKSRVKTRLQIPNIQTPLLKELLGLKNVDFSASNGVLFDLSTFHRTNDYVNVTYVNDDKRVFRIKVSVGLKNAYFYYRNYVAHLLEDFENSGKLKLRVVENSIGLQLLVNKISCRATLEKVQLDNISKLVLKLDGLGKLNNWRLNEVANKMWPALTKKVEPQIESWMSEIIISSLNDQNICQLM